MLYNTKIKRVSLHFFKSLEKSTTREVRKNAVTSWACKEDSIISLGQVLVSRDTGAHLGPRQRIDWLALGELFYYAQKFPFTSLEKGRLLITSLERCLENAIT